MKNATILLAVVAMLAMSAQAGVVSYTAINNDADSGVQVGGQAGEGYTHKLDFTEENSSGIQGTCASINGVLFDIMLAPSRKGWSFDYPALNISIDGSGSMYYDPFIVIWQSGGSHPIPSGEGLKDLMDDIMWNQTGTPQWYSLTLYNLTPGKLYDARIYKRDGKGGTMQATISFDVDADGVIEDSVFGFQENDATDVPPGMATANQPYYISYQYTAGSTGELEIRFDNTVCAFWTIAGLTNEAVPEPATLALLGIGGIGVLIRRRRK